MVVELPSRAEIKKLYEDRARIEGELKKLGPEPERAEPPQIIDYSGEYFTDVGNAHTLVQMFGQDIRFVPLWKAWMHWTGSHWARCEPGRQGYPKHLINCAEKVTKAMRERAERLKLSEYQEKLMKHACASESWTRIKSMINLAEAADGVVMSPDDFDKNKFLFNVQNGTLNLLTGEYYTHRREDYITKISPVSYDAHAKAPLWQAFLERIMKNNPEIIPYLQNLAGQCLTGEVREKAMYMFWGPKGDNGKTTFIETIQYILDQYAQTIPVESLLKAESARIPNDIAGLKGARFVYSSEPDLGATLSEGMIKKLTGLNTIKARFLNQEFFQFKPEFKLVIETNPRPNIKAVDGGTWNRVKCIPFTENIPLAEQDKTLQSKLRGESSGILNWMIEGCRAWLANGMITPEIVLQATEEYKEDSDKFSEFINYCLVKDSQGFMAHNILYPLYKLWCANNEQYPVAFNKFTEMMLERGFQSVRGYINNSIKTPDAAGQTKIRVRGFAGVTGQTWLMESVQLILTTADSDYEQAKWLFGQTARTKRDSCVLVSSCEEVQKDTSTLSSLSNQQQEPANTDSINLLYSVHSVQSVQNNKDILIQIKDKLIERFGGYNRIDFINVLDNNRIKTMEEIYLDMDTVLVTEIEAIKNEYEDASREIRMRAIHHYCHARGWE